MAGRWGDPRVHALAHVDFVCRARFDAENAGWVNVHPDVGAPLLFRGAVAAWLAQRQGVLFHRYVLRKRVDVGAAGLPHLWVADGCTFHVVTMVPLREFYVACSLDIDSNAAHPIDANVTVEC